MCWPPVPILDEPWEKSYKLAHANSKVDDVLLPFISTYHCDVSVLNDSFLRHFLKYLIISPNSALILPLISSHEVPVATELLAGLFDSHSATWRGVRTTLLLDHRGGFHPRGGTHQP